MMTVRLMFHRHCQVVTATNGEAGSASSPLVVF